MFVFVVHGTSGTTDTWPVVVGVHAVSDLVLKSALSEMEGRLAMLKRVRPKCC